MPRSTFNAGEVAFRLFKYAVLCCVAGLLLVSAWLRMTPANAAPPGAVVAPQPQPQPPSEFLNAIKAADVPAAAQATELTDPKWLQDTPVYRKGALNVTPEGQIDSPPKMYYTAAFDILQVKLVTDLVSNDLVYLLGEGWNDNSGQRWYRIVRDVKTRTFNLKTKEPGSQEGTWQLDEKYYLTVSTPEIRGMQELAPVPQELWKLHSEQPAK